MIMTVKAEQQIMSGWKGQRQPLVSIICTTFNHKAYIRDAMDGFLMQVTDFPFEIIVHDDCSTDGTAEIIRDYINSYPSIIKGIFQETNQYSQGRKCTLIAASYAVGDYLALCEGDDYWTDANKIRIQVDEMRKHPECEISFHPAWKIHAGQADFKEVFCRHTTQNSIIDTERIILRGGSFMPTAAICIKKELMGRMLDPAQTFYTTFITAFFLQVFGSLQGGALYIDRIMSVYRYMSVGSWTESTINNGELFLSWAENYQRAVREADLLTARRFSKEFGVVKKRCLSSVLRNEKISTHRRIEFAFENNWDWKDRLMWYTVYKHSTLTVVLKACVRLLRQLLF